MQNYSVLMSVYYKEKAEYLELAIKSMLNQTVSPEQFVIVEDGPLTDELEQVIQKYENEKPDLFTVVRLDENRGLASALNAGLKYCRNELIARMDSDDISLPQRCEKEIELFEKKRELMVCGTNIDEFYGTVNDVRTSRVVPTEYRDIKNFSRRRMPFNHPTVMYKKHAVLKYGGYSADLRRKEDFDLFSQMIVGGSYVENIGESLLLYRADDGNYARRKSSQTLVNALWVYARHFRRGGCNIIDLLIICCGEIVFFLLPISIMKKISNKILRKNKDNLQ